MPVRRQDCGVIPVWRLNSEFFIYTCAAVSLCLCGGKFAVFLPVWQQSCEFYFSPVAISLCLSGSQIKSFVFACVAMSFCL